MSFIAIDCEMVKTTGGESLARVSIVDRQGKILLDEYVKQTEQVTDYKTDDSGITEEDLRTKGRPFNDVKRRVCSLISGYILVGFNLASDLKALQWPHPEDKQCDLAKFMEKEKKNESPSLKDLAKKYLNKNIQVGPHNSVEDARTTMELYKKIFEN